MATVVQTKTQNSGGYNNTNAATLASNVTAGNRLIIAITAGAADTIGSIVGNSNTYTLVGSAISADRATWLYDVQSANSGATTVTVTFGAGQYPDSILIVREYGGLDSSVAFDKTASANSGTDYVNTISATTATTTHANELVVIAGGSSAATPEWSAGSGFGNLSFQAGFDAYTSGALADMSVTSTGAQTGTFNTVSYTRNEIIVATFKESTITPPVDSTKFFQFF